MHTGNEGRVEVWRMSVTHHLPRVVEVRIEAAHGEVVKEVEPREAEVRDDVDELIGQSQVRYAEREVANDLW